MKRAQTVLEDLDAPLERSPTSILHNLLFSVGFASFLLTVGLCFFPWVEMLGDEFRGVVGEGKAVALVSALIAILLCVFQTGRGKGFVQSAAGAWGTLTSIFLIYLWWSLSHDPQFSLQVTWWLPLASLVCLSAGVCFSWMRISNWRTLAIAHLLVFWIGFNAFLLRGDTFSLEAQMDNSLVRPAGK